MQVGSGGGHSLPFVNGGHGGCQVVVVLGDGGAVTWWSMGLGDVASSGQGWPLSCVEPHPPLGPLGICNGLDDGGEV